MGGGPRCVGVEGVGDRGTHAATQLTNEGMAGCANGAKGANGKDYPVHEGLPCLLSRLADV